MTPDTTTASSRARTVRELYEMIAALDRRGSHLGGPGQNSSSRAASARTVRELSERIAALDRRVPHVERLGEISIARAASALKCEALKRIEELESQARSRDRV